MKKQLLVTLISLVLLGVTNSSVLAQSTSPAATGAGQKNAATQAERTSSLKKRAGQEIDRRTKSLNDLVKRINSVKKLTGDQKSSFSSQIQTEINNLDALLRTKINGDTDFETLKADVKSIVDSYRVYLLFMPKIHILAASDVLLETADKFSALADKLKTRLDQAQSAGKDVSALQTALVDMRAKIQDAKTQAQNAAAAVTPLTAEGYPGNKATLQSARAMLETARKDLKAARVDVTIIRTGLNSLVRKKLTSSPTATSTPKLSPTP